MNILNKHRMTREEVARLCDNVKRRISLGEKVNEIVNENKALNESLESTVKALRCLEVKSFNQSLELKRLRGEVYGLRAVNASLKAGDHV